MPDYTITRSLQRTVNVTADTREEALAIAEQELVAITSLPGIYVPEFYAKATAPTVGGLTMSSSRKIAMIFAAPKAGNIHKIHWRTNAVTTATDTDVRLETVDTSTGDPSGTLVGTNTNVTATSGTITANTWITNTLTADATVTAQQMIAIVFVGTGSPNYVIGTNAFGALGVFPYSDIFTGSWAKTGGPVCCAVEYDDGSFAYSPGVIPMSAVNTHTFGNGSTPDEIALKFQFAAPVRVSGFWLASNLSGDTDVILYDSDGTTSLQTKSLDKDIKGQGAGTPLLFSFPAHQNLLANTNYYLSVKPSSATTLSIYSYDVAVVGLFDVTSAGRNMFFSSQTDAGGWSDTTTRRPIMGLIIDGVDDGTGGGTTTIFNIMD